MCEHMIPTADNDHGGNHRCSLDSSTMERGASNGKMLLCICTGCYNTMCLFVYMCGGTHTNRHVWASP